MNEIITRNPHNNEVPLLHTIWGNVFGTTGMDIFFSHFFKPDLCIVAEYNSIPVAAGYLIPFGCLQFNVNNNIHTPCAMIYSVATLPQYRGMGLGTSVVNSLMKTARSSGYPAVVLSPQEDGLFEYYSNRTGLFDFFYVNELVIRNKPSDIYLDLPEPVELNASDYNKIRESLLNEIIHIKHDLHVLEYQEMLCREVGGGLFKIGEICIIVERQSDDVIWLKELLSPFRETDEVSFYTFAAGVVSVISGLFPADEYIVRFPSISNKENFKSRRFGMLVLEDAVLDKSLPVSLLNNIKYSPWYGMAFD